MRLRTISNIYCAACAASSLTRVYIYYSHGIRQVIVVCGYCECRATDTRAPPYQPTLAPHLPRLPGARPYRLRPSLFSLLSPLSLSLSLSLLSLSLTLSLSDSLSLLTLSLSLSVSLSSMYVYVHTCVCNVCLCLFVCLSVCVLVCVCVCACVCIGIG